MLVSLVFLILQWRWPQGWDVVFSLGWGGQLDASGMAFEGRPDGGEGRAMRSSPEGRLPHRGTAHAKVLRQKPARSLGFARRSVWLEQSEGSGQSLVGGAGRSEAVPLARVGREATGRFCTARGHGPT